MFGKVIKREINKMGLPYAIIKGTNGITYYCDDRGMEDGKVDELVIGASVEYVSYKDKKGKLIATHLKCTKANTKELTPAFKFDDKEKECVKKIIIHHITETGPIFLTALNMHLLNKKIDYHAYGYKKQKVFFIENFSDILDFDDVDVNGCPQTKISLKDNVSTTMSYEGGDRAQDDVTENIQLHRA